MELSELVVLLHYEVQKSYDFVKAISRVEADPDASTLHITLEHVEIELPATLKEARFVFDPKKQKDLPASVQLLRLPYTAEVAARRPSLPTQAFTGKTVSVEIIGPNEKIDNRTTSEKIGKIKIILKPIIS